ncbi:unnamed protein product [Ectocarpus fasciculatus]
MGITSRATSRSPGRARGTGSSAIPSTRTSCSKYTRTRCRTARALRRSSSSNRHPTTTPSTRPWRNRKTHLPPPPPPRPKHTRRKSPPLRRISRSRSPRPSSRRPLPTRRVPRGMPAPWNSSLRPSVMRDPTFTTNPAGSGARTGPSRSGSRCPSATYSGPRRMTCMRQFGAWGSRTCRRPRKPSRKKLRPSTARRSFGTSSPVSTTRRRERRRRHSTTWRRT